MNDTLASPPWRPIRKLHSEKRGVRVLGIAESFRVGRTSSTLAGVVMRRDRVVDGIVFGSCTIEGDDATQAILDMYAALNRQDINCIMTDGLIISMYNIIDGHVIKEETGLPVLAITFEETQGLTDIIKAKFGANSTKLQEYQRIGKRERVKLRTRKEVFLRCWGTNSKRALMVLNSFTVQGSIPEPIRVAKIAARAHERHML